MLQDEEPSLMANTGRGGTVEEAWTIPARCGSSGCWACGSEKFLCLSPCAIIPATIAESLARKEATSAASGEGKCLSRFRARTTMAWRKHVCHVHPAKKLTE